MKTNEFMFNSGTLLQALQTVKKVMSSRPLVPVLENYLFTVKGGKLTVTGTDLQNTFKLSLPVHGMDADFSACVPPTVIKYLDKIIKSEGPAPLTLTYDHESYSIEVIDSIARAKYSGENASDFPRSPQTNVDTFETTSNLFKEFKDLLVYTSTDELRPAMTGIAFLDYQKQIYLAGTDGHRLKALNVNDQILPYGGIKPDGKCDAFCSDMRQYFILPSKAAKILSELNFKKENEGVVVRTGSDKQTIETKYSTSDVTLEFISFSFRFGEFEAEFITRLISERYPDIWAVIPEEKETKTRYTTNDKAKFLSVLDRAQLFANATTHQIRLSLNGKLKISAEDLDFKNEYCAEIEGSYTGDQIEIGFNAEYFKDCVNSFGNSFTLEMQAPNRCAVIRDAKQIVLCMPVMLTKYE